MLRRQRETGRDRVDDRDRALERWRHDPDLLGDLALERVHQRLARVNAAAREQPDVAPALVVPAEQDAVTPPEERRDADPRLRADHPDEPNPAAPRSLARELLQLDQVHARRLDRTSCAILIPGSTTKASCLSVLSMITFNSPRYPASISPGELTTVIPCLAARPERGSTRPAHPWHCHREPRPDDTSLAGTELEPLAGGEVEAGVALVGLRRKDGVVAQPRDRKVDHPRSAAEPSCASATR